MPSRSTQLKLAYVALAATDATLAGSSSKAAHRARFLTKPLLMPTLAASLATSSVAAESPLRTTTLAAQAGGWAGDVSLLGEGTKPFLVGSGAFALGHAAYITGFTRSRNRRSNPLHETSTRALAGIWALTAPGMGLGARKKGLAGPVLAYSATLATMVATAHRLDPALPADARRYARIGAALFMLSDSMLGARKFLLPNPPDRLESAVMATYTAGQFFLSESAARA